VAGAPSARMTEPEAIQEQAFTMPLTPEEAERLDTLAAFYRVDAIVFIRLLIREKELALWPSEAERVAYVQGMHHAREAE
jgi:hypothetical protein